MDMASSCPACGAPLVIPPDTRRVRCAYCGVRYDVDLSGIQPALRAAAPLKMPDVLPAPEPEIQADPPEIPQSVPTSKPSVNVFTAERIPPAVRRLPIWLVITIITGLLLCLVFGCMAAVYFALQRAF